MCFGRYREAGSGAELRFCEPDRGHCAERSIPKAEHANLKMNTLDRRTVLKGLGTFMALPVLERMIPLNAFASVPKVRTVRNAYFFVANGVDITHWTPATDGALQLPYILEPLEGVKTSINVLTGLTQQHAFANGDGPGDHARSCAC